MSKTDLLARVRADLTAHIDSLRHALGDSMESATGQETRSSGNTTPAP